MNGVSRPAVVFGEGEQIEKETARELAAIEAILKMFEENGFNVAQGLLVLDRSKDAVQLCSPCRAEKVDLRFGTYLCRRD